MLNVCFGFPTLLALFFSGRWRNTKSWAWSLAAMATVFLNFFVVGFAPRIVPDLPLFKGLEWNWTGKIATITVTLVIFAILPKSLRDETGILTLPKSDRWFLVLLICLGMLCFFWGSAYLTRDGSPVTAEYYAFQSCMPSIDEEFAFRGTILAMLVAAFGKYRSFGGIKLGWGAMPIIVVFGLAHGYSVTQSEGPVDFVSVIIVILSTNSQPMLTQAI